MLKIKNKPSLLYYDDMSNLYPSIFSAQSIELKSIQEIKGVNLLRSGMILTRDGSKSGVHGLLSLEDTVQLFKSLEEIKPKFANFYVNTSPLPIFRSLTQSYFLTQGYKNNLVIPNQVDDKLAYNPYLRRGEIGLIHIDSIYLAENGLLYIDPNAFVYLRTMKNSIEWINREVLETNFILDDFQIIDKIKTLSYYNIPFIDHLFLVKRTNCGRYILIDCPEKIPIDRFAQKKPSRAKRLNIELDYFDTVETQELNETVKQKKDAIKQMNYEKAAELWKKEKEILANMQQHKNEKLSDYCKVISKIGHLRYPQT